MVTQSTLPERSMRSSIAALVLALATCPASGELGRAQFTVAVTVPVRVQLEVIEQPTELRLSAEDVARGYLDVSARYRVRHNDRGGYLLRIVPVSGLAQRIEVHGLGTDLVLSDAAIDVYRPGNEFQQDLAVRFRFVLDEAIHPGTFALPVSLTATPL
jgi:hypothetical protein